MAWGDRAPSKRRRCAPGRTGQHNGTRNPRPIGGARPPTSLPRRRSRSGSGRPNSPRPRSLLDVVRGPVRPPTSRRPGTSRQRGARRSRSSCLEAERSSHFRSSHLPRAEKFRSRLAWPHAPLNSQARQILNEPPQFSSAPADNRDNTEDFLDPSFLLPSAVGGVLGSARSCSVVLGLGHEAVVAPLRAEVVRLSLELLARSGRRRIDLHAAHRVFYGCLGLLRR
jgi:hypothetical protein